MTEFGSPLSDIINKGLERPKFAADCLNVLMKELKLHCQEGTPNCKVRNLIIIFGMAAMLLPQMFPKRNLIVIVILP